MKKHLKKAASRLHLFYHPSLQHPSAALMPAALVLTAMLFAGIAVLAGFLEQVVG